MSICFDFLNLHESWLRSDSHEATSLVNAVIGIYETKPVFLEGTKVKLFTYIQLNLFKSFF